MRELLMVIDLQKGWVHKAATEEAMQRTVALCKKFEGDIIHCCFRNDPNSLFTTLLGWKRFTEPADTDEIPELAALKLPVYWQNTYSRLNDETLPILQKYDMVYLAGVFTDISITATAMDVFDRNIPVSVVTDCVATLHGEDVHAAALKALSFAIGKKQLITSGELA